MAAIACAASLALAGCQTDPVVDKSGGRLRILHFATIDSLDPNGQTPGPAVFLASVEKRSRGRLLISVQSGYGAGVTTAESDLVAAVARGDLDGGWPATRAFSRAGIPQLEPIEAPMVLTSFQAQAAVATGPAGRALLASLRRSGVIGLGLTVGPLRRPWAIRPLRAMADWRGLTFRSYNSPVQDASIKALGAIPVEASYVLLQMLQTGRLQGVETDLAQDVANHYGPLLPFVTADVVLWPKMSVVAVSRRTYRRLTDRERGWLGAAAADAVSASVAFPYDETAAAVAVCSSGVRLVASDEAAQVAFLAALQPVLDDLKRRSATRVNLALVEAAARTHRWVDVPATPPGCAA